MEIKAIEKSKILIPEWRENRKLPLNQQIKVHYKSFPTGALIRSYVVVGWKGDVRVTIYDDTLILVNHVDFIENLKYGKQEIKTPVDLGDCEYPPFSQLMAEIRNYALIDDEGIDEGESEASE